jgi:hypothetical protein
MCLCPRVCLCEWLGQSVCLRMCVCGSSPPVAPVLTCLGPRTPTPSSPKVWSTFPIGLLLCPQDLPRTHKPSSRPHPHPWAPPFSSAHVHFLSVLRLQPSPWRCLSAQTATHRVRILPSSLWVSPLGHISTSYQLRCHITFPSPNP